MTPDIITVLAILVIAMTSFSFELISAEVVGLTVMVALTVTGILSPEEAFQGFGSETVMMILGLLIISAALLRTGVVEMTSGYLLSKGRSDPERLLLITMLSVAFLSSFLSNTAATAFFLPVVFGIAAKTGQSPSRFLMPLAFSSILTSSVTLVSTSSNIVVSGLMSKSGMEPIGMFELTPVGMPITIAGLLYLWFVGRRLLPNEPATSADDAQFGLRPYLTEVMIVQDSPLIGKTLRESKLGEESDLRILRVMRDQSRHLYPQAVMSLKAGDVLLVEGKREDLLKIKDKAGIDLKADAKHGDPDLSAEDLSLVEVVILPRSKLLGRTLKTLRFRENYGLQVLGIDRAREQLRTKLSQIKLRVGDVLLLQGEKTNIRSLEENDAFRILGSVETARLNSARAPIALAIFASVFVLTTLKFLPLAVAALAGAIMVFATRCITPEEAYREVEWKAIILIGGMLSLGAAMETTGTDRYLASMLVDAVGQFGPLAILGSFFALTVALTQPMSNQAAAVVMVPIAIQTALQLGLNPRTFTMMIAVAASCSYLTPLEPSCLMVYGPGKYRFRDFFKVGFLLTFIIFAIAILLVPRIWPLAVK